MLRRVGWVFLIAVGLLAGCQSEAASKGGKPGADAPTSAKAAMFPEFKVKTLEAGTEVSLSQYRGKVVILDLFATWCPPCRMEIPHFVELQEKYKGSVSVVGLSYDQAPVKEVLAFAREMKINYDLFWGSEEIAKHVGLRGIPHTLVLDKEGRVIKSYVGYRDKNVFEKDIQALLGDAKP